MALSESTRAKLLRRGPYVVYALTIVAILLVTVGMILDSYSHSDCPRSDTSYTFGWDDVRAEPSNSIKYKDCDQRAECEDLEKTGRVTITMGIFTVLGATLSILFYHIYSSPGNKWIKTASLVLYTLSTFFCLFYFSIWSSESDSPVENFVTEDCNVELHTSIDLAIAGFVFLVAATITRGSLLVVEIPYRSVE